MPPKTCQNCFTVTGAFASYCPYCKIKFIPLSAYVNGSWDKYKKEKCKEKILEESIKTEK